MMPRQIEGIRSRGIMGLTPDARAGCCEHLAWWVEGAGPLTTDSGPLPHGRSGYRLPSLAGLGLSDHRLDPGRPEGDPGAIVHGPGLGNEAVHLDRVALADRLRRHAGHLDREQVGGAVAHGQELDDVQRLAVLVGPGPLGLEVDHRLRRHRAHKRDRRRVHRELHGYLLLIRRRPSDATVYTSRCIDGRSLTAPPRVVVTRHRKVGAG